MRVAGSSRGVPGLTAEELALRAQLRTAKANVRKGKRLAHLWSQRATDADIMPHSDWVMLDNLWHGRTEQLVCDIQGRSKDRNFKMPSLWLDPEHKR